MTLTVARRGVVRRSAPRSSASSSPTAVAVFVVRRGCRRHRRARSRRACDGCSRRSGRARTARPLVGVVAAGLAIGGEPERARSRRARRWHLLPLVPVALTYLARVALSAPLGLRPWSSSSSASSRCRSPRCTTRGGGCTIGGCFLRGERRLIGSSPSPALIAGCGERVRVVRRPGRSPPGRAAGRHRRAARSDRGDRRPAVRSIRHSRLHEVTRTGGSMAADAPMPTRWRTAALDEYDGRRWTPTLTIRPIGRTLGPATGPTIGADVSFLDDDLTLVPLPGSPVSRWTPTSRPTGIARSSGSPSGPNRATSVGIVSNVAPDSTTHRRSGRRPCAKSTRTSRA